MRLSRLAFIAFLLGAVPASAAPTPDAWITTKSKIALLTTSHLNSKSVHVDTIDGRVTLHGKVTNQLQKENAESVVRSVEGVKGVRNLLQVVAEADVKITEERDDRIKELTEKMFRTDPILASSNMGLKSVNNGVVLLSGKARNLDDYLLALESTSLVPGVRRVNSEIKFSDQLGASKDTALDSWITMDTKMRLIADGNVPALNISVDTYRGSVTLFGIVSSNEAKLAAVADTKKVDSVVSVNDELQVLPPATQERQDRMEAKDDVSLRNIKTAFKTHPEFKNIDVSVKNGVAHLTGTVKSGWQRLEAAMLARSINGVHSVDDDLHL